MMFEAIYHFFWGKPINFNSPYTLDETYQYLQDASELDKQKSAMWRFIRTLLIGRGQSFKLFKLESIDSRSYRFHINQDVGQNMSINTYGQVEEGDSGVKVVGVVEVTATTRLFIIGCLLSWVVITLLPIQTGVSDLFSLSIVFIGIFLLSIKTDQNGVYNTIHVTLGKSKKKNNGI
jgi:hypothetical protein